MDWDKVRRLRRETEERRVEQEADGLSCPSCRSRRTNSILLALQLSKGTWSCQACGFTWIPASPR